MATQGKGSYQVTGWDEQAFHEADSARLTKAHFTNTFSGDIQGDGSADYLMAYPSDTYASFVGLQRVDGSVGGRAGSFVLQATGVFEAGKAKAEWFVVPDSGTGDLKGLKGKGGYQSGDAGSAEVTLNYSFE